MLNFADLFSILFVPEFSPLVKLPCELTLAHRHTYVFVGVSEAKPELLCTAGVPCPGPHAVHQQPGTSCVLVHHGNNIRRTDSVRLVLLEFFLSCCPHMWSRNKINGC